MNLDTFDRQILACLQADARQSLAEIGARVGLSTTPCWNRIKRMERAGVITGYTVRIDPAAIGFAETVIVQVVHPLVWPAVSLATSTAPPSSTRSPSRRTRSTFVGV